MKKILVMAAIAAGSMLVSSCGFGTTSIVNPNKTTQTNGTSGATLGGVAGALLGGAVNNATAGVGGLATNGLSLLTNLLGINTVNPNTITGTWTYQQPHVSFESSNVLSQIGGEMMGNKISSTLGTYLTKIGLKQGVTTFTFDGKGGMTMTMGGKTTQGTYKLDGNQLTMTGALGYTNLTCTVSMAGNQLYMLFDAKTLFNVITKMGSSVGALSNILGSYNGMKMGWECTK